MVDYIDNTHLREKKLINSAIIFIYMHPSLHRDDAKTAAKNGKKETRGPKVQNKKISGWKSQAKVNQTNIDLWSV